MSWHPVEDYTKIVEMAGINKIHEFFRSTISAGDTEWPGHLISPRFIERMLHDRHELNMGKTELLYMRNQTFCKFTIGKETVRI